MYDLRIILGVFVAPHVGAWIEILNLHHFQYFLHVAPHVGAWIEIDFVEYLDT